MSVRKPKGNAKSASARAAVDKPAAVAKADDAPEQTWIVCTCGKRVKTEAFAAHEETHAQDEE